MAQLIDLGALRFVFRGAYSSSATYGLNDVVTFSNSVYVVVSDTVVTNTTPTNAAPWALMIPAGATFLQGTLAARPATFSGNRMYYVIGDSTSTNNGQLYYDTGSAWVQVVGGTFRAVGSANSDVPLSVVGTSAQTGDLVQFLNGTSTVARVSARGAYLAPVAPLTTFGLDTAANGYRPLTITVTNTAGTVTLSTTTLTYDSTSGNLTQVVTVADGRTTTRVLTYDANNNLTSATEQITAGA